MSQTTYQAVRSFSSLSKHKHKDLEDNRKESINTKAYWNALTMHKYK